MLVEPLVGVLLFLRLLFLGLGHVLEGEVDIVFGRFAHLLEYLFVVDLANPGQVFALGVENNHPRIFLLHVLVLEVPKRVVVGGIFRLIEELLGLG